MFTILPRRAREIPPAIADRGGKRRQSNKLSRYPDYPQRHRNQRSVLVGHYVLVSLKPRAADVRLRT
jgi:hypothetical protein